MKNGVLVESIAGFAEKGSRTISRQLSRAFYVRNGEIQFPIKDDMVSCLGFDWHKQVSNISKDTEHLQNAVVPSLFVENVRK